VAAARTRRLLSGELVEGELVVDAEVVPGTAGGPPSLRAVVALPAGARPGLPETPLRVSIGRAGPGAPAVVRHDLFTPRDVVDGQWTYSAPLDPADDADRPWIAVVVEDLEDGRWGGALVEPIDG
jgi:hypothetical protein